jgi:uncharacterized protein (TIGR03067 family)
MRKATWVVGMTVVLFMSALGSADEKHQAVEKELAKMQGLYGSQGANFSHTGGQEVIAQPVAEMFKTHRIEGNKWLTVDARGKATAEAAIITLNPSASPKKIELTYTQKGEQVKRYGIYEVSDRGLSVHWGPALNTGGTKPAPRQFLRRGNPVKGVDGLVTVYSRIKE